VLPLRPPAGGSDTEASEIGLAMMPALTLDSRVTTGPDAVFRELDGEAVILNLDTGLYFGLNDVGTRIWQLIETHTDLRRVFEILRVEFDVADDRLQTDLLALVENLCDKGLVRVESTGR
jgi:hypothetical protein